jgi:hypothetical protein
MTLTRDASGLGAPEGVAFGAEEVAGVLVPIASWLGVTRFGVAEVNGPTRDSPATPTTARTSPTTRSTAPVRRARVTEPTLPYLQLA